MSSYLNSEQIEELVGNNLYSYKENPYIARCFSTDYRNTPSLPALSLPGGDVGEFAILLAASVTYGFELNLSKARDILFELIGGKKNSTFHLGNEHTMELCRYIEDVQKRPKSYYLNENDVKKLNELNITLGPSSNIESKGPMKPEKACIIIEAEDGLFPQYAYAGDYGVVNANILVFQKTFVDRRHRKLSELLITNGAVKLFEGLESDYLYEILSEMTENHLFETLKSRDSLLPIYFVTVTSDKKIKIKAY